MSGHLLSGLLPGVGSGDSDQRFPEILTETSTDASTRLACAFRRSVPALQSCFPIRRSACINKRVSLTDERE